MSYDNSKSTPSSSTRGRVTGADEKDQEPEPQGLNNQDANSSGQPSANVTTLEQGAGEGSGSGEDQRGPNSDDMDGVSSGNDSGERESVVGRERVNRSRGDQSTRSSHSHSSSNGKDSAMMLETTESNKR